MADPHAKRWLADDPRFLASLNDLDGDIAEKGEPGDGNGLMPSAPPSQPVPATQPPALPLQPASRATAGAMGFARPPAVAASARVVRRPLLDLFPPSALEPEPPSLPMPGTAVGPTLPPARPRRIPAPRPTPDAPSPLAALTYGTFYGLREKPFSLSTDPKFLYHSASHERAGQDLLASIRARGGVAVLTGPSGMGKTTLCRSLVEELDRRTVTSLVLEPHLSIDDLLKAVLVDFGVISREDLTRAPQVARDVLTSTLASFLESLVPLQASAVVIIDDAQDLPVALLGGLGAMLGAAGPGARVLQVVLVGQPALTSLLKRSELRSLSAGVTRRIDLGPLGADEIAGYVAHRLSVAGGHTRIEFNDAAIARLSALSAGVPRVVNLLCDRALARGQQSSAGVIDEALVDAAAADLDLDLPRGGDRGLLATLLLVAAFAFLVLAGAAAALWVSRDAVSRTMLQWQNIPLAPGGPVPRLPAPIAPIPPPEISDAPTADPSTKLGVAPISSKGDTLQPDPAI